MMVQYILSLTWLIIPYIYVYSLGVDQSRYKSGLTFSIYDGYHYENFDYSQTANISTQYNVTTGSTNILSTISTSTNKAIIPKQPYLDISIEWSGYLYTNNYNGIWTFNIYSDDGSYVWLDNNLLINNGGRHSYKRMSNNITLLPNMYYPIRILYGQLEGVYSFKFTFIVPNKSTENSDGTGLFYSIITPIDTTTTTTTTTTASSTLTPTVIPTTTLNLNATESSTYVNMTSSLSLSSNQPSLISTIEPSIIQNSNESLHNTTYIPTIVTTEIPSFVQVVPLPSTSINYNITLNESNNTYVNGLEFHIYNGYHQDNIGYTDTATLSTLFHQSSGSSSDFTSLFSATANLVYPYMNVTEFTIEWKGYIYTNHYVTGDWRFDMYSDDGSYVWINDELIIDNSGIHLRLQKYGTISLLTDSIYSIRVMYGQSQNTYNFRMTVQPPDANISPFSDATGVFYHQVINETTVLSDFIPTTYPTIQPRLIMNATIPAKSQSSVYTVSPNSVQTNTPSVQITDIPLITESIYTEGLFFNIYDGYHNNDLFYTQTATPSPLFALTSGVSSNFTDLLDATDSIIYPFFPIINITVEWRGYLFTGDNKDGLWEFEVTSDDRTYMWINDVLIISGTQAGRPAVGSILLSKSTYNKMRIMYGQESGSFYFNMRYRPSASAMSFMSGTGVFYHIEGDVATYPTHQPTTAPSPWPSVLPSVQPSIIPTSMPTFAPSFLPSSTPTSTPTLYNSNYTFYHNGLSFNIYDGYHNNDLFYTQIASPSPLFALTSGISSNFTDLLDATDSIIYPFFPIINITVEWRGYIFTGDCEDGLWEFEVTSDDSTYMWINDVLIISGKQTGQSTVGSILLSKNSYNKVRIMYGQESGAFYFYMRYCPPQSSVSYTAGVGVYYHIEGEVATYPTYQPTTAPSIIPSALPTVLPSIIPTLTPTVMPTSTPTSIPTVNYIYYHSGLSFHIYDGYHNNDLFYTQTASPSPLFALTSGVSSNFTDLLDATDSIIYPFFQVQNITVEWRGYIFTGDYEDGLWEFEIISDNNTYIWINQTLVVNGATIHSNSTVHGHIYLPSFTFNSIRIMYGHTTGATYFSMLVKPPGNHTIPFYSSESIYYHIENEISLYNYPTYQPTPLPTLLPTNKPIRESAVCLAGQYLKDNAFCMDCPIGTYSDKNTNYKCEKCPLSFTPGTATCQPGKITEILSGELSSKLKDPLKFIIYDPITVLILDTCIIYRYDALKQKVSTLVGNGTCSGSIDGVGSTASFTNPRSMVLDDKTKYIYITDVTTIRKLHINGTLTTFVGDATKSAVVDGDGILANFVDAYDLVINSAGDRYMYVIEASTIYVRRIDLTSPYKVTTIFSSDIKSKTASIITDSKGNLYITGERTFLKLSFLNLPVSTTSTSLTTTNTTTTTTTNANTTNATTTSATITMTNSSTDTTSMNRLLSSKMHRSKISRFHITDFTVSSDISITTFLPTNTEIGYKDGLLTDALFGIITSVAIDTLGNLYVVDSTNRAIREITVNGYVLTLLNPEITNNTQFFPSTVNIANNGILFFTTINPTTVALLTSGCALNQYSSTGLTQDCVPVPDGYELVSPYENLIVKIPTTPSVSYTTYYLSKVSNTYITLQVGLNSTSDSSGSLSCLAILKSTHSFTPTYIQTFGHKIFFKSILSNSDFFIFNFTNLIPVSLYTINCYTSLDSGPSQLSPTLLQFTACCKMITYTNAPMAIYGNLSVYTTNPEYLNPSTFVYSFHLLPLPSDQVIITPIIYTRNISSDNSSDESSYTIIESNIQTIPPYFIFRSSNSSSSTSPLASFYIQAPNEYSGHYLLSLQVSGPSASEYISSYNTTIKLLPYYGPLPPPIFIRSIFSDSGLNIYMIFDEPTDRAGIYISTSWPCSYLFDFISVESSTCIWLNSSTVLATISTDSMIVPDDPIYIKSNLLRAFCTPQITNCTINIPIEQTNTTLLPPLIPIIPKVVLLESTVSICDNLVLDASSSTGNGGRKYTNIEWMIYKNDILDVQLTNYANLFNDTIGKSIQISADMVSDIFAGTYRIKLKLTNIFGNTGTGETTIIVSDNQLNPSIFLTGKNALIFKASESLRIRNIAYNSPCSTYDAILNFQWNIYTYQSKSLLKNITNLSRNPKEYILDPYTLSLQEGGDSSNTYLIDQIVSSYVNNTLQGLSTISLAVTFIPADVSAIITGGYQRQIPMDRNFILDASLSRDLSYSPSTISSKLLYIWTCSIESIDLYGQPCGLKDIYSDIDDLESLASPNYVNVTINAFTLLPAYAYKFTLIVYTLDGRIDSKILKVTAVSGGALLALNPTVTYISEGQPLKIVGTITSSLPVTATWKLFLNNQEIYLDSLTPLTRNYTEIQVTNGISFPLAMTNQALLAPYTYTFKLIASSIKYETVTRIIANTTQLYMSPYNYTNTTNITSNYTDNIPIYNTTANINEYDYNYTGPSHFNYTYDSNYTDNFPIYNTSNFNYDYNDTNRDDNNYTYGNISEILNSTYQLNNSSYDDITNTTNIDYNIITTYDYYSINETISFLYMSEIETTITVIPIPYNGYIDITPNTGLALDTTFTIYALNWGCDPVGYPLRYTFFYQLTSTSPEISLATNSSTPYVTTQLPAGYDSYNNTIYIKVIIYNALDGFTISTSQVQVFPNTNVDVTAYVENNFNIALNNYNYDLLYQTIGGATSVYNTVNCTFAPLCSLLNREPCSTVPNTCGSCYSGYTGIIGPSNYPCITNTHRDTLLINGDNCILDSDCQSQYCYNRTCATPNKSCPSSSTTTTTTNDICSGYGTCLYFNAADIEIDTCLVTDPYCTAQCICDLGYGGKDCSLSYNDLDQRDIARRNICSTLLNTLLQQNPSKALVGSLVTSLLSTYSPDEVRTKETLDICTQATITATTLAASGYLEDASTSNTANYLVDAISSFSIVPATSKSPAVNAYVTYAVSSDGNTTTTDIPPPTVNLDAVEMLVTQFQGGYSSNLVSGQTPAVFASDSLKLSVQRDLASTFEGAELSVPASESDYGVPQPSLRLPPTGLAGCPGVSGKVSISLTGWKKNIYSNSNQSVAPALRFSIIPRSGNVELPPTNTTSDIQNSPFYIILPFTTRQSFNITQVLSGQPVGKVDIPGCSIYDARLKKSVKCIGCNISDVTLDNVTYQCQDISLLCNSIPLNTNKRRYLIQAERYLSSRGDGGATGGDDDSIGSSSSTSSSIGSAFSSILEQLLEELKKVTSAGFTNFDPKRAIAVIPLVVGLFVFMLVGIILFIRWDRHDRHMMLYIQTELDKKENKKAVVVRNSSNPNVFTVQSNMNRSNTIYYEHHLHEKWLPSHVQTTTAPLTTTTNTANNHKKSIDMMSSRQPTNSIFQEDIIAVDNRYNLRKSTHVVPPLRSTRLSDQQQHDSNIIAYNNPMYTDRLSTANMEYLEKLEDNDDDDRRSFTFGRLSEYIGRKTSHEVTKMNLNEPPIGVGNEHSRMSFSHPRASMDNSLMKSHYRSTTANAAADMSSNHRKSSPTKSAIRTLSPRPPSPPRPPRTVDPSSPNNTTMMRKSSQQYIYDNFSPRSADTLDTAPMTTGRRDEFISSNNNNIQHSQSTHHNHYIHVHDMTPIRQSRRSVETIDNGNNTYNSQNQQIPSSPKKDDGLIYEDSLNEDIYKQEIFTKQVNIIIHDFLDTMFPSWIFENKSKWSLFFEALIKHHNYLNVFSEPSLVSTRTLRFIDMCQSILMLFFFDTLFFYIGYPDTSVCKMSQTKVDCLSIVSSFSSEPICKWNKVTYTCSYNEPPQTGIFSIILSLVTLLLAAPTTAIFSYILEAICKRRPDLSKWGLNSDEWLGVSPESHMHVLEPSTFQLKKLLQSSDYLAIQAAFFSTKNSPYGRKNSHQSRQSIDILDDLETMMIQPAYDKTHTNYTHDTSFSPRTNHTENKNHSNTDKEVQGVPSCDSPLEKGHHHKQMSDTMTEIEIYYDQLHDFSITDRQESMALLQRTQLLLQEKYLAIAGTSAWYIYRKQVHALIDELGLFPNGQPMQLSLYQYIRYGNLIKLHANRIYHARKKSEKLKNLILDLNNCEVYYNDAIFIQTFIKEQLSYAKKFMYERYDMYGDNVVEKVHPLLWLLGWIFMIGSNLYILIFIYQWGYANAGDTYKQWGYNFGVSFAQDFLYIQIVTVYVKHIVGIESLRTQLLSIHKTLKHSTKRVVKKLYPIYYKYDIQSVDPEYNIKYSLRNTDNQSIAKMTTVNSTATTTTTTANVNPHSQPIDHKDTTNTSTESHSHSQSHSNIYNNNSNDDVSNIKVCQHFSPTIRTSTYKAFRQLAACKILCELTDRDIERCKEEKVTNFTFITLLIIGIPATLSILFPDLGDMLIDYLVTSSISGFILAFSTLYAIQAIFIAIPIIIIICTIIYYYYIYKPATERARIQGIVPRTRNKTLYEYFYENTGDNEDDDEDNDEFHERLKSNHIHFFDKIVFFCSLEGLKYICCMHYIYSPYRDQEWKRLNNRHIRHKLKQVLHRMDDSSLAIYNSGNTVIHNNNDNNLQNDSNNSILYHNNDDMVTARHRAKSLVTMIEKKEIQLPDTIISMLSDYNGRIANSSIYSTITTPMLPLFSPRKKPVDKEKSEAALTQSAGVHPVRRHSQKKQKLDIHDYEWFSIQPTINLHDTFIRMCCRYIALTMTDLSVVYGYEDAEEFVEYYMIPELDLYMEIQLLNDMWLYYKPGHTTIPYEIQIKILNKRVAYRHTHFYIPPALRDTYISDDDSHVTSEINSSHPDSYASSALHQSAESKVHVPKLNFSNVSSAVPSAKSNIPVSKSHTPSITSNKKKNTIKYTIDNLNEYDEINQIFISVINLKIWLMRQKFHTLEDEYDDDMTKSDTNTDNEGNNNNDDDYEDTYGNTDDDQEYNSNNNNHNHDSNQYSYEQYNKNDTTAIYGGYEGDEVNSHSYGNQSSDISEYDLGSNLEHTTTTNNNISYFNRSYNNPYRGNKNISHDSDASDIFEM